LSNPNKNVLNMRPTLNSSKKGNIELKSSVFLRQHECFIYIVKKGINTIYKGDFISNTNKDKIQE